MASLLIKNIGKIVSGDIKKPIIEGDAVLVEDGKIKKVGKGSEIGSRADRVINANGITLTPGLINSHCHVAVGDWTPRQNQIGFIESSVHGGVTSVISAGEVHIPGRPTDVAGTKALATLTAKAFANFHPGGAKVMGGGLILEKGLEEKDFKELAEAGVKHVGEIGLGSVKMPEDAAPMVKLAKKYGMTVLMHTGGTSIPGSSTITADMVIKTDPDVVGHLNGGTTAIFPEEVEKLVKGTSLTCELVECGNHKVSLQVIKLAREINAFDRIILGTDDPSGTGVITLGILKNLTFLSSVGEVKGEEAIAMATGNTARVYKLNRGLIKEGLEADFVLMDAPMGSVGKDALQAIEAGDIPGVSMVIIDGAVVVSRSRNTPPPNRKASVEA
ncbi:MAG: amidohydrolase family protein [Dehalococcoidia bacterium]|nr:amidohydrolase family protein [Dehalococcoidia bacterium]